MLFLFFYLFLPSHIHQLFLVIKQGAEKAPTLKGMNGKSKTCFEVAPSMDAFTVVFKNKTRTLWNIKRQFRAPN